jgi:hypothetical protein
MIAFVYRLVASKDLPNDLAYCNIINVIDLIATVLVCKLFERRRCSILAATPTATPIGFAVVYLVYFADI